MAINGERIGNRFKKIWNKVRDEISRCITVVTYNPNAPCPNCYYSSSEHASSGQYKPGGPKPFRYGRCPVCGGKGVLEVKLKKIIPAEIVWKGRASAMAKESLITFYTPGEEDMDIVRIKVGLCYRDKLNKCDHIIVDGYKCSILRPLAEAGIKYKASLTFYAKTRDKKDAPV